MLPIQTSSIRSIPIGMANVSPCAYTRGPLGTRLAGGNKVLLYGSFNRNYIERSRKGPISGVNAHVEYNAPPSFRFAPLGRRHGHKKRTPKGPPTPPARPLKGSES